MFASSRENVLFNKFKERLMGCARYELLSENRKVLQELSTLVVCYWRQNMSYQISEAQYHREENKIRKLSEQIQPGELESEAKVAVKEAEEYLRIIGMYRVRRKCRVF